MVVFKGFSIILDQPKGVYIPGQKISGHVLLSLDKPLKMKGQWNFSFVAFMTISG